MDLKRFISNGGVAVVFLLGMMTLGGCPHFEEIPEFQGGEGDGGADVGDALGECSNAGDCASLPNAIASCDDGTCSYECSSTHVDKDDDVLANGCECEIAAEVCDGVDNDCDGVVDDAFGDGMVSAGDGRTCALDNAGRVFCWGTGFLGDGGADQESLLPRRVTALSGASAFIVAQNNASCAVSQQGVVSCWGDNTTGRLGAGSDAVRTLETPVTVPQPQGGTNETIIGIGRDFACFLTPGAAAPNVACAGNNELGQLGTESSTSTSDLERTALTQAAADLAVGGQHACVAISNGGAKCWGNHADGQLGTGLSESSSQTPKSIADSRVPSEVSAGADFSCAIVPDATLCWGMGAEGQLGNVSEAGEGSSEPVEVRMADVVLLLDGISSGAATTCGWNTDGELWCWGASLTGGEAAFEPVPLEFSQAFVAVDVGASHACGIDDSGRLWCWGRNSGGQLGSGNIGGIAESPLAVTCPQ